MEWPAQLTNFSHYPLAFLKMLVEDSEITVSRFQFDVMRYISGAITFKLLVEVSRNAS